MKSVHSDPTKEPLVDKDFKITELIYDDGTLYCTCKLYGEQIDFEVWAGHAEFEPFLPKEEYKEWTAILDEHHNLHFLLLKHNGKVVYRTINLESHLETLAEERINN